MYVCQSLASVQYVVCLYTLGFKLVCFLAWLVCAREIHLVCRVMYALSGKNNIRWALVAEVERHEIVLRLGKIRLTGRVDKVE
jgi:hypothetical protein